MSERVERRLAAILVADVVGYSRLMGGDEAGTRARLRGVRNELIDPGVSRHQGRIVKTTGDGLLVEFQSVVEAVACAISWQEQMAKHNANSSAKSQLAFRIGINLGDVIVEEDDIHGDAVNLAARLETLAEPGGICVSALVRDQVRGRLACDFADLGERQLKNIAYPVRVYRVTPGSGPQVSSQNVGALLTPAIAPATSPLNDTPSIAVLPFQNMSGDPEQEYFADGMAEEIITALSRIRWLFVIARNSSFSYKGQSPDIKQVGRDLSVRYVLEGSVRKSTTRIRITAQLIDAETGAHLWADRFDGDLEDVFDLQDRIALSVAGIIEPTLQANEVQRVSRRPTTDLATYDLYLRAYQMMLSPARDVPQVLGVLDQALARDPDFGPALAWAAICHFLCDINGWSDDEERNRLTGLERGRRALQVADDDPAILANSAFALAVLGENIDAMMGFADRALSLNPGFARGWHCSGGIRLYAGHLESSIEHVETSMRLSPRARVGWGLYVIGHALFFLRRFDEAVAKLLFATQEDPNFPAGLRILAASYAQLGQIDEARHVIHRIRPITKMIRPANIPYRKPEHRELYISGLDLVVGELGFGIDKSPN